MTSTTFSGRNRGLQVARNDGSIIAEFHHSIIHKSHSTEDINRICLQALRCPDPFLVKNRLKKTKDKLLRQSFEWVLQTTQYQSWKKGDDVCLLWIKGGAGKGKTMMSIGLIEGLLQEEHECGVVTYFFFQNGDNELNTLVALIKGLILRLVTQCTELKEVLRDLWDVENDRFICDFTSWQVLWDVFLDILNRCSHPRVYIVIDALDECRNEDMASFLKLIVRNGLDNPKKIKWLLTSRPSDVADRALIPGHDQTQVSLELNSDSVSQSVQAYVSHKVDELGHQNRYADALRNELKTHLSSKAEGTFLWVSLVCKGLEDVSRDNVLAVIQQFPTGLQALYSQKLQDLLRHDRTNCQSEIELLQIMTLVYRPLKVDEIPVVTGLAIDEDCIQAVVARCGSFIVIRESFVEFIHQSARDFLNGGYQLAPLNPNDKLGHHRIVVNCVSQLSQRLKVNLLGLPPYAKSEEISNSLELHPRLDLNCLDYAVTFWAQHLRELDPDEVVQSGMLKDGLVGDFLHTKLLEWFECSSLLNQLHMAIDSLEGLLDLTKGISSEYEFIQDATRFLRRHFNMVMRWPLQIYSSALILSPKSSTVRSGNLSKLPSYFRSIPDTGNRWKYLLREIYSPGVCSMSFAPDGKQFASGSSSGCMGLWNSTTGACKLTMRISSLYKVQAVCFSPDGGRIAAGSDDQIIRVYDTATGSLGMLVRTSEYRLERPRSLLFSRDGSHLISGSAYGVITYWEATAGKVMKAFTGHSGPVNAMDLSRDGKNLASGSSDGTVKLWNPATGSWKMTIEGHSGPVHAVSFSADSMTLASGSFDQTIRIWDARTGRILNTIERYSSPVYALQFHPNGRMLASGSEDGYIRISDVATGANLQTFPDCRGAIHAMHFSPNGRLLVTGSLGGSIKIWDTATFNLHQPIIQQLSKIDKMVISPDNKLIASFNFGNGRVDIRDAKTGYLQSHFDSHTGFIYSLVFSPNSKEIVSCSSGGEIILWDLENGHQRTLELSRELAHVLAFSPDGKWIALGFPRKKFRILDSITGKSLRVLAGKSEWITAAAFSPDSTKIAASYSDRTINVWNLAAAAAAKGTAIWKIPLPALFNLTPERNIVTAKEIRDLQFSTDMRYLLTDGGLIPLADSVSISDDPSINLYNLYFKDEWICYGVTPIIWISNGGMGISYATHGDRVTISYPGGHLLIFEIDRALLQFELQSSGFWMDQNAVLR